MDSNNGFFQPSLSSNGSCTNIRKTLNTMFHSTLFQSLIILLVVIDCILVFLELFLELKFLSQGCDQKKNPENKAIFILRSLSLSILSAFAVEIILKIYAMKLKFFQSKLEIFDAVIVFTSLVLDLIFFEHDETSSIMIEIIIALRLWRVVRIVHGIIVSSTAPLEHLLEKERHLRRTFESLSQQNINTIKHLEEKISKLEEELKFSIIDNIKN